MKAMFLTFLGLALMETCPARTYLQVEEETPPSCEVVRLRLMEVAKRHKEASVLLNAYAPEELTPRQLEALANILNRMPGLQNDRFHERLTVFHEWKTSLVGTARLVNLTTGKLHWSDPFHGSFPPGVEVKIADGLVTYSQKMTYEEFCVLDPKINLRLDSTEFQATNDLKQL